MLVVELVKLPDSVYILANIGDALMPKTESWEGARSRDQ